MTAIGDRGRWPATRNCPRTIGSEPRRRVPFTPISLGGCAFFALQSKKTPSRCGGMGERLIPAVLKTVVPARVPGVRIPLPPPLSLPGCPTEACQEIPSTEKKKVLSFMVHRAAMKANFRWGCLRFSPRGIYLRLRGRSIPATTLLRMATRSRAFAETRCAHHDMRRDQCALGLQRLFLERQFQRQRRRGLADHLAVLVH